MVGIIVGAIVSAIDGTALEGSFVGLVDGRALDGITVGDFVRAIEGTVLVGTFVGLVNGRALLDGRTDGALVGVMAPVKKQVVDGLNVIGRLEEVVGEEDG